jgi:hypothetical protein
MRYLAYCYSCEAKVATFLKRGGEKNLTLEDLKLALHSNEDVLVGHPASSGDHEWKLNRQEKGNLLGAIERGDVKWVG